MFLILFNKIIDVSFKHKSTCCLQAQQNPGSPTSPPSGEEAKQKKETRPPPQKKKSGRHSKLMLDLLLIRVHRRLHRHGCRLRKLSIRSRKRDRRLGGGGGLSKNFQRTLKGLSKDFQADFQKHFRKDLQKDFQKDFRKDFQRTFNGLSKGLSK